MRARNIKPGFYKNEDLAECSVWARLIFPGLWMMADREGRLEDRPKRIKAELLPFDAVEVEPLLEELVARGFIRRYERDGLKLIQIVNFAKHQAPHHTEKPSTLPPPAESDATPGAPVTTEARQEHSRSEGVWKTGGLQEHSRSEGVWKTGGLQEHSRSEGVWKTGGLQEHSRSEGVWKRGSLPPDSLNHESPNPESLNPESVVVDDARAREAAAAEHSPPPNGSPPVYPLHASTPSLADPIHARAVELTVLLRQRGAALQAADPRVRGWAERGITDAQALMALETAKRQRRERGSLQPINAGYLDAILQSLTQADSRSTARRSIHDERAEVIAVLTGRRRAEGSARIIDITPAAQPPLARCVG